MKILCIMSGNTEEIKEAKVKPVPRRFPPKFKKLDRFFSKEATVDSKEEEEVPEAEEADDEVPELDEESDEEAPEDHPAKNGVAPKGPTMKKKTRWDMWFDDDLADLDPEAAEQLYKESVNMAARARAAVKENQKKRAREGPVGTKDDPVQIDSDEEEPPKKVPKHRYTAKFTVSATKLVPYGSDDDDDA